MSYADLPVFKGPDGYPADRMEEIVREISAVPAACIARNSFPKLIPWCEYIEQLNDAKRDPNYVFKPEIELAQAEYDPYLIDVPWLASSIHGLMIIMAAVSVVGIFGNLLCLPWLNSVSNRTGATLYMTLAAVCDILYIFGIWLLFFYQFFNKTIDAQLQVYQEWTVNIVPIGLPITNFFNLLSIWLLVALLIDRLPVAAQTISPQTELNLDENAKAAVYRKRSRCRYTVYFFVMVLFFALYTVPMCFEYAEKKHDRAQKPCLIQFLLFFKQYKITMLIVLRPIVEILLPSVLLLWYLVLIRDKKYGLKQRGQGFFVPHLIKNWEDDPIAPSTEILDPAAVVPQNPQLKAYMVQPVLDLSFLECKRWRNESIVSRMAINIALIYLLNMLVQAMSYFVRIDAKTSRELREIFFYFGLLVNVFVVSMKPISYLLTSKSVIKEFKEIQRTASALKTTRNSAETRRMATHPAPAWRLMRNSPEGQQILDE